MRTAILFIVAQLIYCFPATSASAQTIIAPFLTFDGPQHTPGGVPFQGGGEDKLQDDSLTAFFDNGDGMLGVGDIFVGVITLSEINSSGNLSEEVGAHEQIAIVTSATITGPGSVANSFAFVPTAAANPNSLISLFGAVPGVAGNIGPDSIGLMFSTSMNADSANANDPSGSNDPLNWTYSFLSGNFGVAGAGGWSWEATVGLTPGTSDFAEFLPTLPFGVGGTERAGVTIEAAVFDNNGWLPVDVFDFAGVTHLSDFTLDTATFDPASQDELDRGWTFRDQGSFFINPAPPAGDCNAHTIGFWRNRHGRGIITENDWLDDLAELNLRNQAGSHFDPSTIQQWAGWLQDANAQNMAYMLSAQMAGMWLNIAAGFVGPDDLVIVEKQDGTLENLDISDVVDAANELLGLDPIPDDDGLLELVSGHPDAEQPASDSVITLADFDGTLREYAGFLKDILDDGNNNRNWVGGCDCDPSEMSLTADLGPGKITEK